MLPEQVMRQCLPKPAEYDAEYEKLLGLDADRRQEIVFIGPQMDESQIAEDLNKCLCTSDELEVYRCNWAGEQERIERRKAPIVLPSACA